MTALRIILLLVGVFGAVARPARLPAWALPLAAVVVDVASGAISLPAARTAVDPLRAPIGFLLAAVPLAVLLDRLGFFSSLAGLLTRGRHGVGGLWALAALVITVLNLDAGVVLLTPLYVGIARRDGRDPLVLAFPPVLLACLASSALPVSNLTNLIAASRTGAGSSAFLAHLGLPSLVAAGVGWMAYHRFVLDPAGRAPAPGSGLTPRIGKGDGRRTPVPDPPPTSGSATGSAPMTGPGRPGWRTAEARPLLVGGVVMTALLVGFVGGGTIGVDPWVVAFGADAVLLVAERFLFERGGWGGLLPWRAVPIGTALVALSLGVLAAGAAMHLGVDRFVTGHSTLDLARTTALSALAANLFNNLPALLVALPAVGPHVAPALWAVLLGVNMGPVVLVTGSLASLLWLETLGRLGVDARARDFTRVGLRVGLPGAVSGLAVSLALHAIGWT